MTTPSDGWDADEREILEGLAGELEAVRQLHANDPPVDLLRAAHAGVLGDELRAGATRRLETDAWSRAIVAGLDEAETPLGQEDAGRLLADIRRRARPASDARVRWTWRSGFLLAAASVAVAAAAVWLARRDGVQSIPVKPPEATVAVAPPPPPAFHLPLDKPELKVSPAGLTMRRAGGNTLLADLKPAFDAFRADEYAAAARAFDALAARYPDSIEIAFYGGVSRLFLNDAPGAIANLTIAEKLADGAFAADVGWYRAVAEERAGHVANARARLSALCSGPGPRAQGACEALKRLPNP